MSTSTLRIIIAVVFLGHGLGHVLGVLAALGFKLTPKHSADSWLLTGIVGEKISRGLVFVIFLAGTLAYVGAGLGLFGWLVSVSMWAQWAVWAAVISLAGLALFFNAFPTFFPNWVGANAVNIAVLVALLWLHWPPALLGG
jgi:hypothetical protein